MKGLVIISCGSRQSTITMLCVLVHDWVMILLKIFNINYDTNYESMVKLFNENPKNEIDEIITCYAFNFFVVWEKLPCWHYFNSQLLLKVDDYEKHAQSN